jgi:hypothetical protein
MTDSCNKNQQDAPFLNFILVNNSLPKYTPFRNFILAKNSLPEMMHFLAFIIRIYHDARASECQNE